jgi:hypothetical protein
MPYAPKWGQQERDRKREREREKASSTYNYHRYLKGFRSPLEYVTDLTSNTSYVP